MRARPSIYLLSGERRSIRFRAIADTSISRNRQVIGISVKRESSTRSASTIYVRDRKQLTEQLIGEVTFIIVTPKWNGMAVKPRRELERSPQPLLICRAGQLRGTETCISTALLASSRLWRFPRGSAIAAAIGFSDALSRKRCERHPARDCSTSREPRGDQSKNINKPRRGAE